MVAVNRKINAAVIVMVNVPAIDFCCSNIFQLGDLICRPISPANPSPKAITKTPTLTADGLVDHKRVNNKVILNPYATVP